MYDVFLTLLKAKGVRVADVAKATGIPYSTFSDWKSGRSKPKQNKLQKIADYFGVPLEYLLTGEVPSGGYYLDEDTAALAQELLERPELRTLFDASRKASKEDVEFVVNMLQHLYEREHPDD